MPTDDGPAIPSPALFPGAPIPGPPTVISNIPPAAEAKSPSVQDMLLPSGQPAADTPLLPAEGAPR